MRVGIKAKQVMGVTSIVGTVVVILSLVYLARLAQVIIDESRARADLVAHTIYQSAHDIVVEGVDPGATLRADRGLRKILESSLYSNNVTYAAIADVNGVAIAAADPESQGRPLDPAEDLAQLGARPPLEQLLAIYADQGRNYELHSPLLLGNTQIGSIRIGVSTLLIRHELNASLQPAIATALIALTVTVFAAMLLAQWLLRPIHVIRSGLTRLGRGEFGVRLDLDQDDEFGELGTFFNTVSAQLSADRSQMAGQVANLESAVEHIEDAVAIVSPKGDFLFANPAMRMFVPNAAVGRPLGDLVAAGQPIRQLFEQTLASRQARGPLESGERLLLTHPVNDASGELVGIMIIARNLEYLSQVQSTIRYSRKLAALGRLSAGVAHEVKNPLNAMMIHLELLRQQVQARSTGESLQHVDTIAGEIRRLDEVVQGFLKFTRPEDLKLQPVHLKGLFDEVIPIVRPEAERNGVALAVECDSPDVNGDPAMLRQAFLNLALNACQAMPDGGTLRIQCEAIRGRRVAITIADTGVGIKPEHLQRIFDLYFTTKVKGSGIGLSMVYRTVQMHDGEIEVESTPGAGTTFKVVLPQA
ncbi:MAG TPA: ATP-binding protein [Vicinamibacterales bacterium]|jgi:signal transduction histidine kinase|nr:ATP-binding protein [Vicinamibacterales bacterium]